MKHFLSPALLFAALFLSARDAAAQRLVASAHGPTVRVSAYGSYSHAPRRVWVPGHYETRCERVWIPGWIERLWVEPLFELRLDACGNRVRVELCAGYWKSVHHPGRHGTREVRVWIPGHYEVRARCD